MTQRQDRFLSVFRTIFRAAPLAIVLAAGLLVAQPAAAQMQEEDFFGNRARPSTNLPVDEYNSIPAGLLLSDDTKGDIPQQQKAVLDYTAISALYRQEKYIDILDSLENLSASGKPEAQELLGIMHAMGQGVEKNPKRAFDLISRAANALRPLAMHHMGIIYYTGNGVQKDLVMALQWLHLSVLYYNDGPERDRARADRDAILKALNRRQRETAAEMVRQWLTGKGEEYILPRFEQQISAP